MDFGAISLLKGFPNVDFPAGRHELRMVNNIVNTMSAFSQRIIPETSSRQPSGIILARFWWLLAASGRHVVVFVAARTL